MSSIGAPELLLIGLVLFIIVAVLGGGVVLLLLLQRRNRQIMTPHVGPHPEPPPGHR
jgi:hypothetical protein